MAPEPPERRPEPALFGAPATPARSWRVVAAATIVLQFGYWPVVAAVVQAAEGRAAFGELLALGLSVMPLVFIVMAFGSRHPRAPRAVLRGMGLFVVVGLPIALLDVVAGLVAGYGAGAVATLRRTVDAPVTRARTVAVVLAAVYASITTGLVPPVGMVFGALVTLPAVAAGDAVVRRRIGSDRQPNNLRPP